MIRADGPTLERIARRLGREHGFVLGEPRSSTDVEPFETLTTKPVSVEVRSVEKTVRVQATLTFALIAAIFLTWFFLSAGSRGRWSWSLRLLSFLLLGAVYWFIYWFSTNAATVEPVFPIIRTIK